MVEENKSKIEELKKKLYDPNYQTRSGYREGVLHQVRREVKEDWDVDKEKEKMKNQPRKPKSSIFKKFFIVSMIFFIGALGYSAYNFLSNDSSVSSNKIEIQIIGNSFTKGGDDLSLQIEVTNKNTSSLELATLIVEYPRGADDDTDVVRLDRDQIGTIAPGESVIRNIKVKLYGAEKSIRNIKASLEYHPEGSNATFTKDKYYPVTISLAPLSLNIEAPSETTADQTITFKITAKLNTSLSENNSILQVTYPNSFVFEKAIPVPSLGNSTWDLSSLSLTNPITVEIIGRVTGQEGDEQVFHAYAGTTDNSDSSKVNVVYSSVLQKVSIVKPFLDAKIFVNNLDAKEYTATSGNEVGARIAWANNLSTIITDGQIVVSLSGNAFDKNNVDPGNGYYDSVNNQIIWSRSTLSELSSIDPGESGEVSFSFTPKSSTGLSNTIKNPQVSIKVSIKGRQPLLGSTYADINNFSEKIVKIISDFQVATSVAYTSGNIPPKAENETSYIVTWTLSNSVNSINQAVITANLPLSVNWVGPVFGSKENIAYNSIDREVTWNIGSVLPNTGIDVNREASFIITLKPSLSQIGKSPSLLESINLTGTDSFTNSIIKSSKGSITASSATGLGLVSGGGTVIQ